MEKRKKNQKTDKQSSKKYRPRKKAELKVTFTINVGGTEYDITDKKPEDLPDELKEALIPAQKLYAKLAVDSAWRDFYNNLPKDLKDKYDSGSLIEKRKIQSVWSDMVLKEMDNQADDTEK